MGDPATTQKLWKRQFGMKTPKYSYSVFIRVPNLDDNWHWVTSSTLSYCRKSKVQQLRNRYEAMIVRTPRGHFWTEESYSEDELFCEGKVMT